MEEKLKRNINNPKSLAYRLKYAMDARGMTNADICIRANLGSSTVSQYISGKYEPKQDKIVLLAQALNVSELWLMGLLPLDDMSGGSIRVREELENLFNNMSMEGQEIAMTVMRALAVTYKKT